MRRALAFILAISILAFGFSSLAQAGGSRTALGITLTILPTCLIAVDDTSRYVSGHCNFPRPYRVFTANARLVPQALHATRCNVGASREAHTGERAACGASRNSFVTVVYY